MKRKIGTWVWRLPPVIWARLPRRLRGFAIDSMFLP